MGEPTLPLPSLLHQTSADPSTSSWFFFQLWQVLCHTDLNQITVELQRDCQDIFGCLSNKMQVAWHVYSVIQRKLTFNFNLITQELQT